MEKLLSKDQGKECLIDLIKNIDITEAKINVSEDKKSATIIIEYKK